MRLVFLVPIAVASLATACESQTESLTPEKPLESGFETQDALGLVNYYRDLLNLSPVSLDETLSRGAVAHGQYLVQTGEFSHEQTEPDWNSPLGEQAGMNSVMARNVTGVYEAIELWMGSLYHRIPILEPGLERIGVAFTQANDGAGIAIMDVLSGLGSRAQTDTVLLYPAPGQTEIPLEFTAAEIPDPVPDHYARPTGPILTAMLPGQSDVYVDLDNVRLVDTATDQVLEASVRFSPVLHNVLSIVPRDPLHPESRYHVEVAGTIDGQVWNPDWHFSTILLSE